MLQVFLTVLVACLFACTSVSRHPPPLTSSQSPDDGGEPSHTDVSASLADADDAAAPLQDTQGVQSPEVADTHSTDTPSTDLSAPVEISDTPSGDAEAEDVVDSDTPPLVCDDGDPCTIDVATAEGDCAVAGAPPGPCEWVGQWVSSQQNPVLWPTATAPGQGADNIYAADLMWHEGRWWMWYGAQGNDGHDAIYLSWSKDLVTWQKYPSWSAPQPVVDHGAANHVNDPSVVLVGGTFYMYYTEAFTAEDDKVHLATSSDGINWAKQGAVIEPGAAGSWEVDRVGRPSVLYEEGEFRMWYDGQIFGVARHVGYATSPDGVSWTKSPANPVVLHEGAVDVERVDDTYVLVSEAHQGTKLYVSETPTDWHYLGFVTENSGSPYDAFGQVTPHLVVKDGDAVALFVGGASDSCWCKNRLAVYFPQGDVAGCSACSGQELSCQQACEGNGTTYGFCGTPGSTDPGACCVCCDDWDC